MLLLFNVHESYILHVVSRGNEIHAQFVKQCHTVKDKLPSRSSMCNNKHSQHIKQVLVFHFWYMQLYDDGKKTQRMASPVKRWNENKLITREYNPTLIYWNPGTSILHTRTHTSDINHRQPVDWQWKRVHRMIVSAYMISIHFFVWKIETRS